MLRHLGKWVSGILPLGTVIHPERGGSSPRQALSCCRSCDLAYILSCTLYAVSLNFLT